MPINENCHYHPASPYAISKVGTDLVGKYFHEAFGMKVLITRMFTHTGPRRGDVFAESSFAKQIALIEAKKIKPSINLIWLSIDIRSEEYIYFLILLLVLQFKTISFSFKVISTKSINSPPPH